MCVWPGGRFPISSGVKYFELEPAEKWKEEDRGSRSFYVYILEFDAPPPRPVDIRLRGGDKDGVLRYVGHTRNPRARLKQHEDPENENEVTSGAVFRMVYLVELPTREAATWYEWFLKQMHAKRPEDVGLHIRQVGKETERTKRRLGMLPRRRWPWVVGLYVAAASAVWLWALMMENCGGSSPRRAVDAGAGSDVGARVKSGAVRSEQSRARVQSIDEVRATAITAMNEVEVLHDELLRILEARVVAAQGDDATTRSATDTLVLAQIAKRHDMDRLRSDVTAEEEWRIESAIRHAGLVGDRLQAGIAALKEDPGNGSR